MWLPGRWQPRHGNWTDVVVLWKQQWNLLNMSELQPMTINDDYYWKKKRESKKAQSKETLLTMASRALPWSTHNNNNSVSYQLSWHAKLLVHIPLVFCDRQACGEYLSVIHVIHLSKKITQCNLLTAFHKNRRGGIRWQQHFQPIFKLSHDKSAFSHTHVTPGGISTISVLLFVTMEGGEHCIETTICGFALAMRHGH